MKRRTRSTISGIAAGTLAVGVMLDDCRMENGPLLLLPGSHKGAVYDHHSDGFFCGAMDPADCDVDFGKAVASTGPARIGRDVFR